MKVLLMADGVVGQDISRFLFDHYPEDIACVVTTGKNEIYLDAQKRGYLTLIYESEAQLLGAVSRGVDLGVLAWWPRIIRQPIIKLANRGFINTHPSLLPYNRGKHYNFWALVEQSPFGVTLHAVDDGIDTGPILAQQAISYDWTDTGESLYRKAQLAMVALFQSSYPEIREGTLVPRVQLANEGSFHHSSEIELASQIVLNKDYSAAYLLNLLRARTFEGHPACWFEDHGSRYQVTIKIERIDS